MKSVLLGCITAAILAFGAWTVLEKEQTTATTAYATQAVRLTAGH